MTYLNWNIIITSKQKHLRKFKTATYLPVRDLSLINIQCICYIIIILRWLLYTISSVFAGLVIYIFLDVLVLSALWKSSTQGLVLR